MIRLVLCLAAILSVHSPVQAAFAQLPQPGKNAIAASLVPESTAVVPGQTVTLVLMRHGPFPAPAHPHR